MTHDEFDTLRKQLAKQDSARLADFIVNLAVSNDEIYQAVKILAQRDDPKAVVKSIRARLAGLKRSTRYYHGREGSVLERKLDTVLDLTRDEVMPAQPNKAVELLGAFIELDAYVFEHADDSYGTFGMIFHNAAELFSQACHACDDTDLRAKWFNRLAQTNDYGARDSIFRFAATILSKPDLDALIADWCARNAQTTKSDTYDSKATSLRIQLAQVAKSAGNADLYAQVKMEGNTPEESPLVALNVARCYLELGHPSEALAYLPNDGNRSTQSDVRSLLIQIQDAMGDTSAANGNRLDSFKDAPSKLAADEYLAHLPEEERTDAQTQLRAIVDQGDYCWNTKARYYIDWGDLSAAADLVEANPVAVSDASYYTQSDFAKALKRTHPRAATLLLRGAVEQTLAQAKSKYYNHAVRYIQQLVELEDCTADWKTVERHDDWFPKMMDRHARKSAFIEKLKAAKIL
jgi:hypothetical protein